MTDVAAVIWPVACVVMAALAGRVAMLWLGMRSKEHLAAMERDERATGTVAQLSKKVETLEAALKTWIANNSRR